jgi:hypothetical protein
MSTLSILILVVAVAVIVVGGIVYLNERSKRLRSRFGAEYSRAVAETGSKLRAESNLEKLQKRVDKFAIHPLTPEVAARFRDVWRAIQGEFVDDPGTALGDADHLLGEVMTTRGYPVGTFEERAAEISVNHAAVVEHYRAGHKIAMSQAKGRATTEDMRQAMIHYRALFEDLVGVPEMARARAAGSSR